MNNDKTWQLVNDLRKFADFVETHGAELPDIGVDLRSRLWSWDDDDDVPAAVAATLRAGIKDADEVTKDYGTSNFSLHLEFGELQYSVVCNRDEVCERTVVGTEMVTEDVPPVGEWTTETVERDIVEWVCNPLLAIAKDVD